MKPVLEVIRHIFENYGQVRQTLLNEHSQSVKKIVYTLTEPLRTVSAQIKDIQMLEKEKIPYSDIQLIKKALNIIKNTNDFEKGKANWYGKTPEK